MSGITGVITVSRGFLRNVEIKMARVDELEEEIERLRAALEETLQCHGLGHEPDTIVREALEHE